MLGLHGGGLAWPPLLWYWQYQGRLVCNLLLPEMDRLKEGGPGKLRLEKWSIGRLRHLSEPGIVELPELFDLPGMLFREVF